LDTTTTPITTKHFTMDNTNVICDIIRLDTARPIILSYIHKITITIIMIVFITLLLIVFNVLLNILTIFYIGNKYL
jgi:hypothetical protein